MKCEKCGSDIDVQEHHVIPRSEGGTETICLCQACHTEYHSDNGDFQRWGRKLYLERGREYMAEIGRRGGKTTAQKYGPEYMRELGRRGGLNSGRWK